MGNIYKTVIETIGHTPLVQINKLISGATVLANLKAEILWHL